MRSLALAAVLLACTGAAQAADHKVQMRTQGTTGGFMVFEPAYLAVQPGDTVTFEPTNPGHNAVSIEGMVPKGATPFKGELNQELKVTFTAPGVYGYACTPHYMMGMVGVVLVGPKPAVNLAEAQAVEHPERAKATMDGLLQQAAQP